MLGDEINRLSVFEFEAARKDQMIAVLQEKVAGLSNQLSLAKNEEVITAQVRGWTESESRHALQESLYKELSVELTSLWVLWPQAALILRLGGEVSRLRKFEAEILSKDQLIEDLREEIESLKLQHHQWESDFMEQKTDVPCDKVYIFDHICIISYFSLTVFSTESKTSSSYHLVFQAE